MPTSEAHVPTQHASRYLTQLCRHADALSHRPGQRLHDHLGPADAHPRMRHVEQTDTDATLDFDQGRCTVHAEPDTLTLRIEADDPDSLRRIQDLITADLERFGTREQLTVTWRNGDNSDQAEDDVDHDHTGEDSHSHDDEHNHDGGHGHDHGSDRAAREGKAGVPQ